MHREVHRTKRCTQRSKGFDRFCGQRKVITVSESNEERDLKLIWSSVTGSGLYQLECTAPKKFSGDSASAGNRKIFPEGFCLHVHYG